MNKENEKEVDDLFKKKLADPVDEVSFREEDWGALEKLLGQHNRKKGIYWLPVLSSAAALLLLFLGWWAFRPQVAPLKPKSSLQAGNHPTQVNTGTNGGSKRQPAHYTPQQPSTANFAVNSSSSKDGSSNKPTLKRYAAAARRTAGSSQTEVKVIVSYTPGETLFAKRPTPVFEAEQIASPPMIFADRVTKNANAVTGLPAFKRNTSSAKPQNGYRPQFALTILAAPDINGVGSFQQGKVGTNVGMQFSVGLSKKLTITTGSIYSAKPYITGFENYHTPYHFPVSPVNVTADCRMLDIPLNIGYQVYNKQQNKISVGTGLSSYLMLHESYKFNYANAYITGPTNYTVPNSNKYFFGVLNLNATYEHRLNSKVGFTVEPYLKLPLTNIGYSQVRLQTTGVAVGLSWNLNTVTKP